MSKLFLKYNVSKKEGPTDPNAVYFVLRIDQDFAARMALQTYAATIIQVDPEFAQDIYDLLERTFGDFIDYLRIADPALAKRIKDGHLPLTPWPTS
jgi:hypothetical protein